jgi:hypothetical protein
MNLVIQAICLHNVKVKVRFFFIATLQSVAKQVAEISLKLIILPACFDIYDEILRGTRKRNYPKIVSYDFT